MATLQVPLLLATTLAAFKKRVPMLDMITLDARADQIKKDQIAYAHVRSLPTAGDYGANGYFSNTNDAQGLLVDVPVTMDQHKHVTLELSHLQTLSDQKIDIAMEDAAYVLGKGVVDFALGKAALAANLSYTETETVANTTKETLSKVRAKMNTNGAGPVRYGLVSGAVATELDNDPLITSGDYYAQRSGSNGYLGWNNLCGFTSIMEYNDLPTTANMSGLFFDPRAIIARTAVPMNALAIAAQLGIPSVASASVQQDPETGIALLAIMHQQPGTLDMFLTLTLLYGAAAGKQGGSAGTITDKAGVRLITA